MNTPIKRFIKRLIPKGQNSPLEKVFVAAFGKHPGWDDHIDDIGFETDIFITVKRLLYIQGIGGNIDSGSWDALQKNQPIEEFKHDLVWFMGDNLIVGRIWSSRDGKGRTSYPMVVCAQCRQLSLEWVLNNVLPLLERVEEACAATISAAEVRLTIENTQKEIRQLTQQCELSPILPPFDTDVISKLTEYPEMGGPNHQGLLRILYHIEREATREHLDTSKGKAFRPTLLRIPISPPPVTESMLLWVNFLLNKFGMNTSVLVLMPLQKQRMDIIIGEPTQLQLYCLRASLKVIPLTSSIPYNLSPEFINKATQLIEDSRNGK
ncbi:MAG: hypothetical protein RQ760_12430 [Sedimentisphaerales bacterium]|nr:hypothetical protein [Sedimentisphaerales bacterium]